MFDNDKFLVVGRDIIALEVSKKSCLELIDKMNTAYQKLGIKQEVKRDAVSLSTSNIKLTDIIWHFLFAIVIFVSIFFVLALILLIGFKPSDFILGIIWFGIPIGYFVLMSVSTINTVKDNESKDREAENSRNLSYQKRFNAEEKRMKNEMVSRGKLSKEVASNRMLVKELDKRLDILYGIVEVYPTYRNLRSMFKLYQYIDSKRCNELTGHNGAYNLFETEIRIEEVINQLKKINAHLGIINKGIQKLSQHFEETNIILSRISDNISSQGDLLGNRLDTIIDRVDKQNNYIDNSLLKHIDSNITNMENRDYMRYKKNDDYYSYIQI